MANPGSRIIARQFLYATNSMLNNTISPFPIDSSLFFLLPAHLK